MLWASCQLAGGGLMSGLSNLQIHVQLGNLIQSRALSVISLPSGHLGQSPQGLGQAPQGFELGTCFSAGVCVCVWGARHPFSAAWFIR